MHSFESLALLCSSTEERNLSSQSWAMSSISSLSWLYGFHACREPILHFQPASYPASIFKKYSHRHSQAGIIKRNHLFHFNRNTAVSAYWSIETLHCSACKPCESPSSQANTYHQPERTFFKGIIWKDLLKRGVSYSI